MLQVGEVGARPEPDGCGAGFRVGERGGAADAFGGAGYEDVEAEGGGGGGGDEGVGVVVEGGGEGKAWVSGRGFSVVDGGKMGDWERGGIPFVKMGFWRDIVGKRVWRLGGAERLGFGD